jgi:hypothetical protein
MFKYEVQHFFCSWNLPQAECYVKHCLLPDLYYYNSRLAEIQGNFRIIVADYLI